MAKTKTTTAKKAEAEETAGTLGKFKVNKKSRLDPILQEHAHTQRAEQLRMREEAEANAEEAEEEED